MEKYRYKLNNTTIIGNDSPTALNVLIGANNEKQYLYELRKLLILDNSQLPISIVTDLSLHKRPGKELWRNIINNTRFIAGSVPVYQAVDVDKTISSKNLLNIIYDQVNCGVKLITIHPTPNYQLLKMSKGRLVPITSRGGAAVAMDMLIKQSTKNIYEQNLDEIIEMAKTYDVILSIGSSFRSANLKDAFDQTYIMELEKQIKIADYCKSSGVNVIIETPGHAAPQDVFSICNRLNLCCPYPIMPLGPMPTDCAFEQDDVAGSIGAVLMGTRGCADILSVVTREEHTGGIPSIESTVSAIKKYVVAKHIIDIYKLNDIKEDNNIAENRSKNHSCILGIDEKCSRCGALCPLDLGTALKDSLNDY